MACDVRVGKNGNITRKKETSWGEYIAPDTYLRASSESLNRTIEHTEDSALVNSNYTTNLIKVGDGVSGSIEASSHGDHIGEDVWGVLGGEASIADPVSAYVLVSYNGTSEYARLTKSTTSLTAELSSDGSSWAVDTNFGTSGVLDLSGTSQDTLTEMTAVITAFTGWDAILFGSGSTASSDMVDFSATEIRNNDERVGGLLMKQAYSSSTTAKLHSIYPADSDECLPSFSYTSNRSLGTDESIGITGCKHNAVALSNAAKDLCKVSITIDGKEEEDGKTDASLSIPNVEAFLAANMKIIFEEADGTLTEMDEVKDYSITLNANVDDNRNIGSYFKKEQIRQSATLEISFTCNNTSTQYALRGNYTGDIAVGMYVYWKSNTYADSTNSIPYSMLMRMPDVKLTDYNSTNSTPDRLTITGAGTVIKPTNTTYTKHLYAYVVDTDTAVY